LHDPHNDIETGQKYENWQNDTQINGNKSFDDDLQDNHEDKQVAGQMNASQITDDRNVVFATGDSN